MANYKKLLSEKQLLKVKQRARALLSTGSDLFAIYYKDKTLIFKTKSGTYKGVVWTQTIEISDATIENIMSAKSFKDVETLVKESQLKVHCTCPAWKFWGMQYKGTKMGYSLIPEYRRPTKQNRMPNRIPFVCKHIFFVLQLYPFWAKALASKFRNYYLKKIESGGISSLERTRLNKINTQIAAKNSYRREPTFSLENQGQEPSQPVQSNQSETSTTEQ